MKNFTIFLLLLLPLQTLLSQVPPPTLQSGEIWTKLFSAAQDYQCRGSIRYIVQDPANPQKLCAVMMAQEDSTVTSQYTNRYVYYSYSFDGGLTWTKNVLNTSAIHSFPYLELYNGVPIIAATLYLQEDSIRVYKDAAFGSSTFSTLGRPFNHYETGTAVISANNGNVVLWTGIRPGFTAVHCYYNGASWSPLTFYDSIGGYSGYSTIDVAPNGELSLFASTYGNLSANMWLRSTNNGVTFNYVTNNTIPGYIIEQQDTLCSFGLHFGKQCIYIGNSAGVVFTVYSSQSFAINSYTKFYIKNRIYFWSQNTGFKLIADKTLIPDLTDSLSGAEVSPVCQPTLGKLPNGTLYCTFTGYKQNDKQIVSNGVSINCGDIYFSYSTDNGNTWSVPVNFTNTPGIDEKHSSVPKTWQGNSPPMIFFIRDLKAGNWSLFMDWGKAPVYGIVKPLPAIIGINSNSENAEYFHLEQNYPNPFNPTTKIKYRIAAKGLVKLSLYDILGSRLKTLVNKIQNPGEYEIEFNAENLSSGVYFYKIETENFSDIRKMILLK